MTEEYTRKCLPASRYFICDPCYVIRDNNLWQELCDNNFDAPEMAVFSTYWGDGEYVDADGVTVYPVDAGIIGAVSVEYKGFCMEEASKLATANNGKFVNFRQPELCEAVYLHISRHLKFGETVILLDVLDDDDDYFDDY